MPIPGRTKVLLSDRPGTKETKCLVIYCLNTYTLNHPVSDTVSLAAGDAFFMGSIFIHFPWKTKYGGNADPLVLSVLIRVTVVPLPDVIAWAGWSRLAAM